MRPFKALLILAALIASLPAAANTCNNFATYTCAHSTPNVVNLVGTGFTHLPVGVFLGNDDFNVTVNGKSVAGDDLIIAAAFPYGMSGSANGVAFSPLSSFPEGGAISQKNGVWTGAVIDTWNAVGISYGNVAFGYANVGAIGNGQVQLSGIPYGTVLYAEIVNPTTGQILYITPNSEAGIYCQTTPEPASLTLVGAGLAGMAGLLHRKLKKS
jgi:PEP-CTERM motif-containing protein